MTRQVTRTIALLSIVLTALCTTAVSQGRPEPTRNLDRLPSALHQHRTVLGNRFHVAGKEQTVYIGELIDAAGAHLPLQITHQQGGQVRLQSAGRPPLSFDGEHAIGVGTRTEESLLETFVMDVPEGMFASVNADAAVRLLGRRFGPDPKVIRNYNGPRYDIYEVTAPVRSRPDGLVRTKLYYFDSQTGLLQSTRYLDRTIGTGVRVETRFANWRTSDGSSYPDRIDRFEDGKLVFSFVATTIAAAPGSDPKAFR